ncbi:MAG: 30S ribosomal protein S17e [bacterium]
MGRIKTSLVKRVTQEVIEKYGDELSKDYNENKEIIKKHLNTPSKKITNIVTGYATRLRKTKEE